MKKIKELFKKFRKWICGCDCHMCKHCSSYSFDYNDWEGFLDCDLVGYETTVPPKEKKPKKSIVKKAAKKSITKNKSK